MSSLGMLDLLKQPMKMVRVADTTKKHSPPSGKRWLIIGGCVNHVTGTDSALEVKQKTDDKTAYRTLVASASGSAEYPLFHMDNEPFVAQFTFFLLNDVMYMKATALGSGAFFNVQVLEFPA